MAVKMCVAKLLHSLSALTTVGKVTDNMYYKNCFKKLTSSNRNGLPNSFYRPSLTNICQLLTMIILEILEILQTVDQVNLINKKQW